MQRVIVLILTFALGLPQALLAQSLRSSLGDLTLTRMADGLDEPWSLAFLPDGGFLVTLRGGELRAYGSDGSFVALEGVPEVVVGDQAGLFDVLVPRDFATSREIFLSYAKAQSDGSGTALAVAHWPEGSSTLQDLRVLFEMSPTTSGLGHYGGRIVEGTDGTLFLTLGERQKFDPAQDMGQHLGKNIRINRDGTIPADNPFVGTDGALPEIWSLGHRNPQGATLDLTGALWAGEHGAEGGDEINKIKKGANYGWPVIAFGQHYGGGKIGEGTAKDGMEQPQKYWDPSIAPSGMLFYSGKLWPEWQGDIFVGSLKFDYIARLDPDDAFAEEQLQSGETLRVRDIREAPDGSIWFLSVGGQSIWKIAPAP